MKDTYVVAKPKVGAVVAAVDLMPNAVEVVVVAGVLSFNDRPPGAEEVVVAGPPSQTQK